MITSSVGRVAASSEERRWGSGGLELRHGPYLAKFAIGNDELAAALRLRFEVFNLELNEGLQSAYASGYDHDEFDAVCDHLIVQHIPSKKIVGTYRLQTGMTASENLGYYSQREFDFAPYQKLRPRLVELGRACIHREHRSTDVLYLLWRGIAGYAVRHGSRFLIGCSSLTSQDSAHGSAVHKRLLEWQVEDSLQTLPHENFAMPVVHSSRADDGVPKLLRTYLAIGARICGPPALDSDFKTIDFLTLLDLEHLHPRIRMRFLGE
jgi:putative hemolysin